MIFFLNYHHCPIAGIDLKIFFQGVINYIKQNHFSKIIFFNIKSKPKQKISRARCGSSFKHKDPLEKKNIFLKTIYMYNFQSLSDQPSKLRNTAEEKSETKGKFFPNKLS